MARDGEQQPDGISPRRRRIDARAAGGTAVARSAARHDPGAAERPADRTDERRANHRRVSEDRRRDPRRPVEARAGAPEPADPLRARDARGRAGRARRRARLPAADRRRDRDARGGAPAHAVAGGLTWNGRAPPAPRNMCTNTSWKSI
ncbi:protein of unknown function [Burkholderia multivorans]